jgi:hypothetical protein
MNQPNINNSFLNSKRSKNPPALNQFSGLKKKDEEKIMKYVLKLSKEEYNNSVINNMKEGVKTVLDLQKSPEFNATEIDFLEFSKYIDSLWSDDTIYGLIKIIPPKKFQENIKQTYVAKIDSQLEFDLGKKIQFRIQQMKHLYKSEVSLYQLNYDF